MNPPNLTYAAGQWYWLVAVVPSQVYSSADVAYVALNNSTYVAWVDRGGIPTKIATEQELWDVLILAGVAVPAGKTASDEAKQSQVNNVNTVLFRALFNHENRIRTLAGQPTITMQQFVTALKSLL